MNEPLIYAKVEGLVAKGLWVFLDEKSYKLILPDLGREVIAKNEDLSGVLPVSVVPRIPLDVLRSSLITGKANPGNFIQKTSNFLRAHISVRNLDDNYCSICGKKSKSMTNTMPMGVCASCV